MPTLQDAVLHAFSTVSRETVLSCYTHVITEFIENPIQVPPELN